MLRLVGSRVLLSRRDLDLNQDVLAEMVGISQSYISGIERGHVENVTLTVVDSLAEALGVSPAYLLGLTDDPLEMGGEQLRDGWAVYEVENPQQHRRVQDLLDEFSTLSPEDQQLALQIIRQISRSRSAARVIG